MTKSGDKIKRGLEDAARIASGKAKILKVDVGFSFERQRGSRWCATIRYDCAFAECHFASLEAVIPWLREHGVQEEILTGVAKDG